MESLNLSIFQPPRVIQAQVNYIIFTLTKYSETVPKPIKKDKKAFSISLNLGIYLQLRFDRSTLDTFHHFAKMVNWKLVSGISGIVILSLAIGLGVGLTTSRNEFIFSHNRMNQKFYFSKKCIFESKF